MTEAEWLAGSDQHPLLEFLRGKTSDRKLRLFACACVRRVWKRMEEAIPQGVEVSERFADGKASRKELKTVKSHLGARGGYSANWAANNALHAVLEDNAEVAASRANQYTATFFYYSILEQERPSASGNQEAALAAREAESRNLTAIVREIFWLPAFRPIALDPSWLTPTVLALAQAAYDNRSLPAGTLDNDRLAVLADALEDAGASGAILDHLRSEGPHVRGCVALDLLLGLK